MPDDIIRIAVVDDHPLMQNGICQLLEAQKNIVVTGRYDCGAVALDGLSRELPDILLLDITLPDTTGNELVRVISRKYTSLRVIALTSIDTPYQVRDMMQHGCSGYVLKSAAPEIILAAVNEVAKGGQYVQEHLQKELLNAVFKQSKNSQLTKREREILTLICQGETNNEIAEKLFLSLRTIENHRFALYQKFDVKNTAGLVKAALQQGLIE